MTYTVRPLSDRTWLRPASARRASRFDSTWTSTLELLGHEVEHLRGRDLVLEVDVLERGIRLDGQLRADAKATSPAVVVAFESKHGPMQYRCDALVEPSWRRGIDWQQNVRSIAKTLESLRAVDRYGAVDTGQQYAGFKAIGGGSATPMPASHMTVDEAWAIIGSFGDVPIGQQRAAGPDAARAAHRKARAFAHPDRHDGDQSLWDQVEQAARVLGVAR